MDPATPENAPFFSALFRHMQMCSMLGCPSVAAEVGKLLLSLDPTGDRFNVLLTLDHFLVTAAKHTHMLAFMGLSKGNDHALSYTSSCLTHIDLAWLDSLTILTCLTYSLCLLSLTFTTLSYHLPPFGPFLLLLHILFTLCRG